MDLRRAPNEHVLVFAIHHAIADGWSLGVLVQDLFAAYIEVVMGSSERSAAGAANLYRVGRNRTGLLATGNAGTARRFLENQAGRCASDVECSHHAGSAQAMALAIPANLTNETRELARRTGVTLFSAFFGAFQIAFCEWSGCHDLVVGTPVANRTKQTARETMGYYAGIVPLRGQIDRIAHCGRSSASGHRLTIDSFANAIPFVELARALGEKSATGYNPLFEVRFALQNHPMPDVSLPNLSAHLSMRSTGTARFQLGCEITEEGEGLEVAWLFRENLFSQRDIEGLDGIFQRVLAGICRSPESRISEC